MTISEEDFKKMFDLVRELHENYTKNIERENENLRVMLADAQKKLDDALAALENIKKKGGTEEALKKWKEIQDKIQENGNQWTWPTSPPSTWQYTTTTTNNTIPYAASDGGGLNITGGTSMNKAYDDFRQQYMSTKLHSKADEDG